MTWNNIRLEILVKISGARRVAEILSDRGVRTGMYVAGGKDAAVSFDYFSSSAGDDKLFAP